MKCVECVCYSYNSDGFLCCLADPRWPAPCEYEDEPIEEEDDPCIGCPTRVLDLNIVLLALAIIAEQVDVLLRRTKK